MNHDMKSIIDFIEKMQNRRENYRKKIGNNFHHETHHKPIEGILDWQTPGEVPHQAL